MSVTGNEIIVVSGRLERFSITNTSGTVRFVLEMTAGDGVHREKLEGSYTCRN